MVTTHAELAARLLRDAAVFFRTVGAQNESLNTQMTENAEVFEQVATLVENDPAGVLDDESADSNGTGNGSAQASDD